MRIERDIRLDMDEVERDNGCIENLRLMTLGSCSIGAYL